MCDCFRDSERVLGKSFPEGEQFGHAILRRKNKKKEKEKNWARIMPRSLNLTFCVSMCVCVCVQVCMQVCAVLRIEPRTSCMPSKHSTTGLHTFPVLLFS
ncbi:Hypothetical predicted protein [Marmota monax]|uniref:Uncharacterized protein n=1 Tax=Marmota monax TaxID=9995 RepID=A0A5E4A8A6_MARMO|nr:Hypothetical predicted protein [Marmota monax]